jgi:hypothetical protein
MKLEKYTTTDKNGKTVTKERYPKLYGKRRKQQKREEAEARQVEHDKLTLEQKINKAVSGSKEHERLVCFQQKKG